MQIVGHLTNLNTHVSLCESPTEGAELELNHSTGDCQ